MRRWLVALSGLVAVALFLVACGSDDASTGAEPEAGGASGLIAFDSDRDGDEEVYVMDADGGNVRQFTDNPAIDRSPAFSPIPR